MEANKRSSGSRHHMQWFLAILRGSKLPLCSGLEAFGSKSVSERLEYGPVAVPRANCLAAFNPKQEEVG